MLLCRDHGVAQRSWQRTTKRVLSDALMTTPEQAEVLDTL